MSQTKVRSLHYWIVVASRDHVQTGVAGGFAQACHGKASPLKRMHAGDWLIYYSSKAVFGEKEACQKFTAIGQIPLPQTDPTSQADEVYAVDMGHGFVPFRRQVQFFPCQEVPIQPLIDQLSFIRDKRHWGGFRYGILSIPHSDFLQIASQLLSAELFSEMLSPEAELLGSL